MSKIEEQSKGNKEGEIRYLTPLNIETTTKKNIVGLKDQELNTLIIRMQVFY